MRVVIKIKMFRQSFLWGTMVCYITNFSKDVNPSRQCFMADTSPLSNENPPSSPFCPAWTGKKITKGDNHSSLSEREAPPSKATSCKAKQWDFGAGRLGGIWSKEGKKKGG
jgi:hypothetical protein